MNYRHGSTIRTTDGFNVGVGSRVFNYYDMKAGIIDNIEFDGWFQLFQDDGTYAFLNGERICTIGTATLKGWI